MLHTSPSPLPIHAVETPPFEHLLSMIRPENSEARTKRLLQLCWDLAYSHAVKVTEQAHEVLDEPEYRITEQLRFPVLIQQPYETSKKRRLDNLELPQLAKVVQLYVRKQGKRIEAVNNK